jgi:hypothetical protein
VLCYSWSNGIGKHSLDRCNGGGSCIFAKQNTRFIDVDCLSRPRAIFIQTIINNASFPDVAWVKITRSSTKSMWFKGEIELS